LVKRRIKFMTTVAILNRFSKNKYSFLSSRSLGYSFFIPHKASLARVKRRCFLSGFSRSHVRFFALSRYNFRSLALSGKLLGVRKSSF